MNIYKSSRHIKFQTLQSLLNTVMLYINQVSFTCIKVFNAYE